MDQAVLKHFSVHTNRPEATTLGQLLAEQGTRLTDKVAYSFLDRRGDIHLQLTYSDVYATALRIASGIRRRCDARQRVAIMLTAPEDFIVCFWACIHAGVLAMPMNPLARAHDCGSQSLLSSSGADLLIADSSVDASGVRRCTLPHLLHEADDNNIASSDDNPIDSPAFIQFTSGSTGDPRGIVITHKNCLHNLQRIHTAFRITSADKGLSWLPLHHDMGLIGHVLQPWFAGIENVFMPTSRFVARPLTWLAAISDHQVTISGAPTFAYRRCIQALVTGKHSDGLTDLSRWRLAYCGAERLSYGVLKDCEQVLACKRFSGNAWYPCYGLAESTLFVSGRFGLRSIDNDKLVSVGPVEASEVMIKNPDGSLCEPGMEGHIHIRSDSVSGCDVVGSGEFVEVSGSSRDTGDLGRIVNRELYVCGRAKGLIKVRGRSISAEDVELYLQDTCTAAGLRRAVALDVISDEGEELALVIAVKGANRSHEDWKTWIRHLVCQQFSITPQSINLVNERQIPMTSSGKPKRYRCRELIRG